MISKSEFGQVLTDAMAGKSVSQVARDTGLNRQQLYRYMKGEALPRADAYLVICNNLGIDPVNLTNVTTARHPFEAMSATHPDFSTLSRAPAVNEISDGHYPWYQVSTLWPNKVVRGVFSVATADGRRTWSLRHARKSFTRFRTREARTTNGFLTSTTGGNLVLWGIWSDPTLNMGAEPFLGMISPILDTLSGRVGAILLPRAGLCHNGPVFVAPRPGPTLRKVLELSGAYDEDDVPEQVRFFFKTNRNLEVPV